MLLKPHVSHFIEKVRLAQIKERISQSREFHVGANKRASDIQACSNVAAKHMRRESSFGSAIIDSSCRFVIRCPLRCLPLGRLPACDQRSTRRDRQSRACRQHWCEFIRCACWRDHSVMSSSGAAKEPVYRMYNSQETSVRRRQLREATKRGEEACETCDNACASRRDL